MPRCECRTNPWSDDWKLEAIHTLIQTISLPRFNSWLCELRTPECDHQFPDCCRNNSRHRYMFHPAKPSTPKISAKLPLPLCRLKTLQQQKKAAIYRVCVLPWNLPSIRSQQRSIFSSPSVKRSQRKRKSAIKKTKRRNWREEPNIQEKEKRNVRPDLHAKWQRRKREVNPRRFEENEKNAKAWNVQECAARRARIWPSWALSWAHTKTSHENRFTV